jgi:hypothetical protein
LPAFAVNRPMMFSEGVALSQLALQQYVFLTQMLFLKNLSNRYFKFFDVKSGIFDHQVFCTDLKARRAVSTVANAVIMITIVSGDISRTRASKSIPLMSGILTSEQ